jgi:tetratricopeptide (TPR) repeat protein
MVGVLALHIAGLSWAVQPGVKIVMIPVEREILLRSAPQKITLIARVEGQVQFRWKLDGPGKIEGDLTSREIVYIPPETIATASTDVAITVLVTDNIGKTTSDTITLRLLSPTPTLTPTPTPTIDSQQAILLEQLLKKADECFKLTFFVEPRGNNAFEFYQQVLKIDFNNHHARDQLLAMLKQYHAWGDMAYNETHYDQALRYYQRYLLIAEYVLEALKDESIAVEILEVHKRLTAFPTPMPTTPSPTPVPTPTLKPTPTRTPTPISFLKPTVAPTISSLEQLIKYADICFASQQFLTPESKNAFVLYKEVLKTDPTNRHAREKIREMLTSYKHWGMSAYNEEKYSQAQRYYQRYLLIAGYVLLDLNDLAVEPEYQEIQTGLNEVESLLTLTPTVSPTSKPTVTPTPKPPVTPTSRPTATPTPKPPVTPKPEAAMTPTPPQNLEDLQKILPQHLTKYQELQTLEQQGNNVNALMIPVLQALIADLKAMERILQDMFDQAAAEKKDDISKRIQSIRERRAAFEQELAQRLQR